MARMPDVLAVTLPDGREIAIGIEARRSIVHACPIGESGFTPCCDRTPFELPRTDRMTLDDDLVTCSSTEAAS